MTKKEIDDGAVVDALLDQIADPIASFTADGDYDQDRVSQAVAEHHPDAAVIVPPRAGAVVSASAESAPTQRDRHLQMTAERGRMAWQKASELQSASQSRDIDRPIQAGHRRHASIAYRADRGDRDRHCSSCAEPNAGVRTPELCPYRLNNRLGWGNCARALSEPASMQHSPRRGSSTEESLPSRNAGVAMWSGLAGPLAPTSNRRQPDDLRPEHPAPCQVLGLSFALCIPAASRDPRQAPPSPPQPRRGPPDDQLGPTPRFTPGRPAARSIFRTAWAPNRCATASPNARSSAATPASVCVARHASFLARRSDVAAMALITPAPRRTDAESR